MSIFENISLSMLASFDSKDGPERRLCAFPGMSSVFVLHPSDRCTERTCSLRKGW